MQQVVEDSQLVSAGDTASPTVTATPASDETLLAGGTSAIALAAGIVAAIAKAKREESERQEPQAARPRKRDGDRRAEPTLPPPDPRTSVIPANAVIAGDRSSLVKGKPKRRWASQVLTAAMLVCFTVCGWCWSQVASQSNGVAYSSPVAPPTLALSGQQRPLRNVTKNIEDVRMGERLVGRNPLRDQTQSPSVITPETHRSVRLEMDAFGVTYEMAFTRSLAWIDQTHAAVGGEIDLVMHEMGLDGKARVIAIDPCPKIEPDDGTGRMIVTGTMQHLASNILSLEIANHPEPLGVTDTHPVWSEDRQAFIVAGQLKTGERLRQLNGTLAQVTSITPHRGPPVNVYNLEVDGEHVYHVTADGLLVHNDCTTYLYDKLSKDGEHLKYGITKNLDTRYTNAELAGGRLKVLASGEKAKMLELERNLHSTLPIGKEEGQKLYEGIQAAKGLLVPPY